MMKMDIEQKKLIPGDGAEKDYFGINVCISGDYAVVGAYKDDDNGPGSGSVYIYKDAEPEPGGD